jgi:redox-sensitive bicupin YhaK (pirin superfamily)
VAVPPLLLSRNETVLSGNAPGEGKVALVKRLSDSGGGANAKVKVSLDQQAQERDVLAAYPLIPASAVVLRPGKERGHANYGWLNTHHSFSFARYYDPQHMGFRALRVINEDWIAGGRGFPMHPHRDMEIITYVLEGALEHKDSLHNGSIIRPGEIQRMTAGTGIRHSEYNPQQDTSVHLLQIWILPDRRGHRPGYAQRTMLPHTKRQPVRLIASPEPSDRKKGAVVIHQDAFLYACKMLPRQSMLHLIRPRRYTWIQVARGKIECNGVMLSAGDGASLQTSGRLQMTSHGASEFLMFDLA